MTVKLTDFGIARAAEQTRLTQVGSVVGTAAYLSPELARGAEATPGADVYALGVVIYQLLTARLPWEGTTLAELATRRENEAPLSPSTYDPDVPETLSEAVLGALAGDPAERYATARELSAALRAGVAGQTPPMATGEAPTRRLSDSTASTRMLDREEPVTPVVAQPYAARPAPVRERPPAAPRGRSGGVRVLRLLGLALLILVLAGIIAAIVLLTTNAGQNTDITQFLKHNVPDQLQSLIDFIKTHTQ
jgi:serine/threonine-protein kinase